MIKNVFIIMNILFLSVCVNAGVITDNYMNAKLFYEAEEYHMSYDIMLAITDKTTEQMLFTGEICEKLGRYDEALQLYNEIIKKEPKSIKAKLSIIKLHLESPLKNIKLAEQELNELYAEVKDSKMKLLVKKLMDRTKEMKKKNKKIETEISIISIYKDNINNSPDSKIVLIGEQEFVSEKKDDYIMDLKILSGYKLFEKENITCMPYLDLNYEFYTTNNENSNFTATIGFATTVNKEMLKISTPVNYSRKITEGKIEEDSLNLSVSVDKAIGRNIVTPHMGLSYSDNYKSESKTVTSAVGCGGRNGQESSYIFYDTSLSHENSDNNALSNKFVTISAGYTKSLRKNIESTFRYTYENKWYEDKDKDVLKKRKNNTNSIELNTNLSCNLIDVEMGIAYEMANSNIALYEYDGMEISCGINKRF